MNAHLTYNRIGRQIWLSLFGRWMFTLLVPWFVPTISYLLIGEPYLDNLYNFAGGTLMIFLMTILAFVPHDWAARYIALKYPSLDSTIKRSALTALAFGLLTFVYITSYMIFIMKFKPFDAMLDGQTMINVYLFELVAVILLTGLYEINYSLNKWKSLQMNKEAIKRAGMQGQLQSLKSQVNPHFLFNSLNTLSALIADEPKRAEQFVDEMARVYRYLLQTNQHELTSLSAEIRFIRSYNHLLRTRYDTGFDLLIDVSDADLEKTIPPLTLQLLLENAVKHNSTLESNPLRVTIRSVGNDLLEISNNRIVKSTPVKSTGLGLPNIMAKYELLSDRLPVIDNDEHHFRVILPLITLKTVSV
ncbi:histidine kinase [Dyadobacter sp. CY261]|uniref:sensor histidine kinase n=1 Tax=Dyadobacter sp. CY261 TaxID=2907203 RepID=UPI001F366D99|nr:histidine kinase [Dyadobacter sp. CY261]MCF0069441.1 histidine kinase [Dyadobacter sp. CY261]